MRQDCSKIGGFFLLSFLIPFRHIEQEQSILLNSFEIPQSFLLINRKINWDLCRVTSAINASVSTKYPCMLITRGDSVEANIVQLATESGLEITATPKGSTNDDTFCNYMELVFKKIGTTCSNPGLVQLDGHSSRFTLKFIDLCARFHFYAVVEPSHTSTSNQALDAGLSQLQQSSST